MKVLIGVLGVLVLVLFMVGIGYGQDMNSLRQEENFLMDIDQQLELQKQEIISMDVKIKDLWKQGKQDEDELNSDGESWKQEYNAFKQEVDQFNSSNRRDENWRNRLKNRENQIQQRKNNIEQRGKNLEFVNQSIKNQWQILKDRHQIWLSKRRENNAKLKAVREKMARFQAKQSECEDAIRRNASPEEIRLKCGDAPFGGANPNLPPLPGRGSSGVAK